LAAWSQAATPAFGSRGIEPFAGQRTEPLQICLLSGFELRSGGRAVPLPTSAQRLAAFLALQERPVQRLFVAGTLWPDAPEDRSSGNLRTALWRLSKPGVQVIDSGAAHLVLAAHVKVDLRDCSARARRIVTRPAEWLDDDVDVIAGAGEVLPDFYDDWVVLERERFRQLRMHALEVLSNELVSARRFAEALETGLAAVAAEPLRESAHRAVVTAHLREGNRGEAIRQYTIYRDLLRRELGLEPSTVMDDLMAGLPIN
jgi:DNA-binding SARP family transcriptional activator